MRIQRGKVNVREVGHNLCWLYLWHSDSLNERANTDVRHGTRNTQGSAPHRTQSSQGRGFVPGDVAQVRIDHRSGARRSIIS